VNACILVETRELDIPRIKERHMKYLPGWEFIGVCSNNNKRLFKDDITLICNEIRTISDYNILMTDYRLYECFLGYDRILICQHDSGLLKEGIDEFLEWDWVGAPWSFQTFGGNGGLSLRNPQACYEICKSHSWTGCNEDIFFCEVMSKSQKYRPAPREVCERFSVEAVFKLGTLGYHAIDKWLEDYEIDQILEQYG